MTTSMQDWESVPTDTESLADDVATVATSVQTGNDADSTLRLEVRKHEDGEKKYAHLRVVPPATLPKKKEGVHFVFVVDVSGSMGSDVEAVGADGTRESNGFSILDLVKHSLLTIVNSLNNDHMVTLISFSDDANVEFSSLRMGKKGLKKAEESIKALQPTACTNLWAGLKQGYDTIKETTESHPEFRSEIMLFTDGMPNVEPPRGHIPTIQRYLKSEEIPTNHSVRTYGFGYSLHSKLLEEIAVIGRGSFSFIPDASLVGTIFIHTLAGILATVPGVQNLKLRMNTASSTDSNKLLGLDSLKELGFVTQGSTLDYFLGNIEVGQARDFVIENPDLNRIQLRYRTPKGEDVVLNAKDFSLDSDSSDSFTPHLARCEATDLMRYVLDGELGKKKPAQNSGYGYYGHQADNSGVTQAEKQEMVRELCEKYEKVFQKTLQVEKKSTKKFMEESFAVLSLEGDALQSPSKRERNPNEDESSTDGVSTTDKSTASLLEGIVEDLKGEVTLSVETAEAWRKWGVFYLRSLAFAHQLQKRNNFKDHGVQHYGGRVFDKEIDRINDVFDTLPPPTASNKDRAGKRTVAVSSMATYNNCYGGCFLPDCEVTMFDGSKKRCDAVRRGDVVKTNKGDAARILCVVKIVGSNMMVVKFNETGLGITPWHPMLSETGEWVFPSEYAEKIKLTNPEKVDKAPTNVVYNFMLESATVSSSKPHAAMDLPELLQNTSLLKDHTMLINDTAAVTFGHGLEDNAVVKHSYWGNMQAMLRDITVMKGFDVGFVELVSETACIKDPKTNLVVKMVQKPLSGEAEEDLTDGCHAHSPVYSCVRKAAANTAAPRLMTEGAHGQENATSSPGCGSPALLARSDNSFIGCAY